MLDFLKELTRRKVWLIGGIYLALGWVLLQVAAVIETTLSLPDWVDQIALVMLGLGFPVALLLAWAQESAAGGGAKTPQGNEATEEKPTEKPGFSVAVLALNNLSDERELDWIADGLSEDIITRLGMVHFLHVTARNSSFAWKGQTPDIRELGKTLNVRYVVDGSIRVIDETLRVTAQLIDTDTGGHVWSENYDHPRDRLSGMQDAVVDVVSGEVLAIILNAELDRLMHVARGDMSVEDIIAICWGKAVRVASAEGTKEAIDLMVRGLRRFPESAELHAELALYCCQNALNYDREGRQDLLAAVEHHLEEASRIAPRASMTLWRHSSVRNMLGEYDKALVAGEQLAKLYPNDRMAPILSDTYRALGRYEDAINIADSWLDTAGTRHFDRPMMLGFKGNACLGAGDFAAAETALREAVGIPPLATTQTSLVVALAHQGKLDEARAECEILKALPNSRSLEEVRKSVQRPFKGPGLD